MSYTHRFSSTQLACMSFHGDAICKSDEGEVDDTIFIGLAQPHFSALTLFVIRLMITSVTMVFPIVKAISFHVISSWEKLLFPTLLHEC